MLFDKDGIYDLNKPLEFELSIKNDNSNFLKVFSAKEALEKGNLFPNLYDEYKEFKPKSISSINEEQKSLNEIISITFVINDLNLYLDLNPDDEYVFNIFKSFIEKLKEKEKKYNEKYGSLNIKQNIMNYTWTDSKWPWEVKNV